MREVKFGYGARRYSPEEREENVRRFVKLATEFLVLEEARDDLKERMGKALKWARISNGFFQREVAEDIGKSPHHISDIERDKTHKVNRDTVRHIAIWLVTHYLSD